jgi:hypothetical protein
LEDVHKEKRVERQGSFIDELLINKYIWKGFDDGKGKEEGD